MEKKWNVIFMLSVAKVILFGKKSKIRALKFIVEFLNCIKGHQNLGIARNLDALILGPSWINTGFDM